MSKTLISAIFEHERLITVEDTLKLVIPQALRCPAPIRQGQYRPLPCVGGSLVAISLRMKRDLILLQELSDDAAWTYINEVVAGYPGSITTIHGRNPEQTSKWLFVLVKVSPQGGQ